MKALSKGLSALLIIVSCFGVYGCVNGINDILDCKAYWEEQGKISDENLDKLDDGVSQLKENEQAYVDGTKTYEEGLATYNSGKAEYTAGKQAYAEGEQTLAAGKAEYEAGVASIQSLETLIAGIAELDTKFKSFDANYPTTFLTATSISGELTNALASAGTQPETAAATIKGFMTTTVEEQSYTYGQLAANIVSALYSSSETPTTQDVLNYITLISTQVPVAVPEEGQVSYEDYFTATTVVKEVLAGIGTNGPSSAQQQLAGGVQQIVGGIIASGNEDLISGLKDAFSTYGIDYTLLADLTKTPMLYEYDQTGTIIGALSVDDFMAADTGIGRVVIAVLNGYSADGLVPTRDAGNVKLAAAKKQLDEGEATLKASAVKLADAEKLLADGEQELADGKAKLAQYEDGESQLIDGLNQLMATKTYTGLKSIADRLGEGFSFMKANGKNVDLDQAATAVKTGREFSASSSVKITKELTTRAYGQGAVIAAALFGLIAGSLALAKKKGSRLFAILAAIAGGAGIAFIQTAGTEMSAEAGSTIAGFNAISGAVVIAVVALIAAVTAKQVPANETPATVEADTKVEE